MLLQIKAKHAQQSRDIYTDINNCTLSRALKDATGDQKALAGVETVEINGKLFPVRPAYTSVFWKKDKINAKSLDPDDILREIEVVGYEK